jgi:hypothetical protein
MKQLVEVVVIGADARPVAGAAVMVAWGTAATPEVALRTNEQGQFRMALPPGCFVISAHAPDGRSGRAELVIEGHEAAGRLKVTVR